MLNRLSLRRFCAQKVRKDDSFHVPKDGVCGSPSEASFLGDYQTKTHESYHLCALFGHLLKRSPFNIVEDGFSGHLKVLLNTFQIPFKRLF